MNGLEACLERGADVIVNTDADNQYAAEDLPRLLEPIQRDRADIVIGARPIDSRPGAVTSPSDSRLSDIGAVPADGRIEQVKVTTPSGSNTVEILPIKPNSVNKLLI